MSSVKKNDWIAINLNAPDNISFENLYDYGITPDNTGLQDEDYYKSLKQVQNTEAFKNKDGSFSDEKFHTFYESALRSYNQYQNINYTQTLLDNIEASPYDIFELGNGKRTMDTSAIISANKDINRTTHGLGSLFETGSPVFDVREVAQANKMRDENGNVLDWSPNDKGGFLKGLLRPSAALAIYDEDGYHMEDGVQVFHHKGDYKLDEKGDPYYELIGNKSLYGRETLHYWDTITDDDGVWNKFDFMDSDGLHKSIGGTVMRTATTLGLYFIPGVGQYLGYAGAAIALGQTLPVLAKAINGIVASNDNKFGQTMTEIENFADRFGHSQSRDVQGKFWSFENIGDIISSSAGQLFQQRMIADIPRKFIKGNQGSYLNASKIGRGLSLGYMASTSATDTYQTFKEAGADDATAGIAVLAVTAGLYGLMNINYFKDWLFTNSWLDEDFALRDTTKRLVEENTLGAFKTFQENMKKPMSEAARRMERIKLFKTIHDKVQSAAKKVAKNASAGARPTEHAIDAAIAAEGEKGGITAGMRATLYLSRMFNEGFEETLEEFGADVAKGVTLGLDKLGVNVTEKGKELDFGLTGRDILSRYTSAFIGGAIGGAVFEGFNHWEGGPYDSLMEKSLGERLLWYERNGYGKEIRDRIDKLYKQGKLGNKNLSAKPKKLQKLDENTEMIVYGSGDENDNQNLFVYNSINAYLDKLDVAIARDDLFSNSEVFDRILKSVTSKRELDDSREETAEEKLYHFLEDYDTAKVLTLQQLGFLSVVRENADKLSLDILKLRRDIEGVKNKIREENHITDNNRSQEEDLFKNNLYLKDLEKELKEKQTAFKEIAEGKRNGYYIGLAHVKANPAYRQLYTEVNEEFSKNLQEGFITTGVENYCLVTRGLNYNELTDEDLKNKIREEYEAMQNIEDEDIDQKIYDYHLRFAQKFNPDIEAANETLKGKQIIFAPDLFVNVAKELADEIGDAPMKQAVSELEKQLTELKDDTSEETGTVRGVLIKDALEKMFPTIPGLSRETDMLRLLSKLNDAVTSGNAYSDVSWFKGLILGKLVGDANAKINRDNEAQKNTDVSISISNRLKDLIAKHKAEIMSSAENLKNFFNSIEDIANIERINELAELLQNDDLDDDDRIELEGDVEDAIKDKFALVNGDGNPVAYNSLMDKINAIYTAIRTDGDVSDNYNDLIKFVSDNTGLETDEAKKFIDSAIFPGKNLAEYVIAEQTKFDPASKLVEQMLDKFQMYSGINLFNAMKLLKDREALKARLIKKDEFGLTDSEEAQLQMALSALRVIAATINGSIDGLNEEINISEGSNLAVTQEELAPIYLQQIKLLVDRIDNLLNLSRMNKGKTAKAQQETFIQITKKRIDSLLDLEEIDFDGEKLNFADLFTGNTSDATIANAKGWISTYTAFENALSKRLREIFAKYKQNNNVSGFIKKIIDKLGTEVYSQNPGVLDNRETTKITPYGNLTYLITRTILSSDKFASLWKTTTAEVDDLIPLYSHEYCTYENVASIVDDVEGYGLFQEMNNQLNNYPVSREGGTEDYVKNRPTAKHFSNTDGIGGVGKTAGVGYFTDKIIKKLYPDAATTAASVTKEAAENLHVSLRLRTDNKPAVTFESIFKEVSTKTESNGKVTELFKLDDLFDDSVYPVKINTAKMQEALNKIDKNKVLALFNSDAKVKILHFDETGLLNIKQALFLMELADKFKFFISGYGDSLQNKAKIVNKDGTSTNSGIEDITHHRTPSLTISMRSQNSGMSENTQLLQELLRETQSLIYENPASKASEFDKKLQEELDKKTANGKIGLSYDDNTYSGTWLTDGSNSLDIIKKMINFVRNFNEVDKEEIQSDPKKKHKVAIITDSEGKANNYRNSLTDAADVIEIVTPKAVQGREFDFVFVDKNYATGPGSKFNNLTDFYTMMTRAKIGAAIIDTNDTFRTLGFTNNKKASAAETTFGSTREQKLAIYKAYTDWRKGLMEDVPDYNSTENNPTPTNTSVSEKSGKPTFTEEDDSRTPVEPDEIIVTTLDDDTAKELSEDSKKRISYYTEKVLNEPGFGSEYDKANLKERQSKLSTNNNLVDHDLFIETLKDPNSNIEDLPLSLASNITDPEQKRGYRHFLTIVSRAFLNNVDSDEDGSNPRLNFIQAADKILVNSLNKAGLPGETIRTSLQDSIQNNTGFFIVKEQWIYYSFKNENEQVLIPIARNDVKDAPALQNGAYKNIEFNLSVPSIKITTNGEMMLHFGDILTELDGLVLDENGDIYFAVIRPDEETDQLITAEDLSREGISAWNYIKDGSGKSMVAVVTGSDTYDLGDDFFRIQKDQSGKIISANKQRYNKDVRQKTSELGIQEICHFSDWVRAVSILSDIVYNGKYESDADQSFLEGFFNETGILAKIGAPGEVSTRSNESRKAKQERFKKLSEYNVLNKDSVNGLASTLLRYCINKNKSGGSKFTNTFVQNFIAWLGTADFYNNDDGLYHRRGFGIRYKSEGKTKLFYVLPNKDNGSGDSYSVLEWKDGKWEEKKTESGKLTNILGPINNIDLNEFIKSALHGVNDIFSLENTEELLSSGQVVCFPVDAYTNAETNAITSTYSVFETTLLYWMKDKNTKENTVSTEVNEITEFLKKDSIFKNQLYRDIKVEEESPQGRGWRKGKIKNPNGLYVDICKIIQPLYYIYSSDRLSDDDEVYKEVLESLESTNDIESDEPAIEVSSFSISDSVVTFTDAVVNAAWLQNNCDGVSEDVAGQFNLISYNNDTSEITISEESGVQTTFTLKSKDVLFKVSPIIARRLGTTIINGLDGKSIEYTNGSIKFKDGDSTYDVTLIGVDENVFTYTDGKGHYYDIELDEQNQKLVRSKDSLSYGRAIRTGHFVGAFEDGGQSRRLYHRNNNLYMQTDWEVETPIQINGFTGTDVILGVAGGDLVVSNHDIVVKLKSIYSQVGEPSFDKCTAENHNGIIVIFGDNSISGTWMQTYTSDESIEEDKVYTLLAIDGNRIGIYEKGDLSTFKWVEKTSEFKTKGLSEPTIVKDPVDFSNPIEQINLMVSEVNGEADSIWADYTSSEEPTYIDFINNDFIEITKNPPEINGVSAKLLRDIFKYLKKNGSDDISNLTAVYYDNNTVSVSYTTQNGTIEGDLSVEDDKVIKVISKEDLNKFTEIEQTYQNEIERLSSVLNNSLLSNQEKVLLETQRDSLISIKNSIDKGIIPGVTLLTSLTSEQKALVLNYRNAVIKKKTC